MNRRSAIGALAALAASPVFANQGESVDIVKIMSFSCEHCLTAEPHDQRIAQVVTAGGGRFVWAPVPSHPDDTGDKERVYFAARDKSARIGEMVKASFYKGTQDTGIALHNFVQAHAWLVQDLPQIEEHLPEIFKRAQSVSGEGSLARTWALVRHAGVTQVPSYIVMSGNYMDSMLDTSSSSTSTIATLRDAVIKRVETLNKKS